VASLVISAVVEGVAAAAEAGRGGQGTIAGNVISTSEAIAIVMKGVAREIVIVTGIGAIAITVTFAHDAHHFAHGLRPLSETFEIETATVR
jgi:hypothetical protein